MQNDNEKLRGNIVALRNSKCKKKCFKKLIKNLLPRVKENVFLKDYTTFKIGGKAKYFFVARTRNDFIKAIKASKQLNLPFFILGNGSNVLFSDKRFEGLVIKIKDAKFKIKNCVINAEAGTPLFLLVQKAQQHSLSGLQWAVSIPGTIGGAVYGNASAFGKAIGDLVKQVEVLDLKNFKIKKLSKKECKFKYKDSIFKHKKNLIIISVILRLKKGDKEKIKKEIQKFLRIRKETQPLNYPSAGCIFKNLKSQISKVKIKKNLLRKFPELRDFIQKGEIPAGYLIDKAGLKGKRIGNAMVSPRHANFIVNLGNATAKDVQKLIADIKKKVKKTFGIELKEEITIFPH